MWVLKNGRDSHSKRLGAKRADGEFATAGSIIYRQRGTKYIQVKMLDMEGRYIVCESRRYCKYDVSVAHVAVYLYIQCKFKSHLVGDFL